MQQPRIRNQLVERIIDHYLVLEYSAERGITLSNEEFNSELRDIREGYSAKAFGETLLKVYVDPEQWMNRLKELLLIKKAIKKAFLNQLDGKGYSFVEVLAMCPTNWKMSAVDSLKFVDKMQESFPLGVFKDKG